MHVVGNDVPLGFRIHPCLPTVEMLQLIRATLNNPEVLESWLSAEIQQLLNTVRITILVAFSPYSNFRHRILGNGKRRH
jgi:hypothetical protein